MCGGKISKTTVSIPKTTTASFNDGAESQVGDLAKGDLVKPAAAEKQRILGEFQMETNIQLTGVRNQILA